MLDVDHDLPPGVARAKVAEGLDQVGQGKGAVDHRLEATRIERTGQQGRLILAEKPAIDPGKELLSIKRSRPGT